MLVLRGKRQLAISCAQWLSLERQMSAQQVTMESAREVSAARPFREVPRVGKFEFMRSFMPGGEFYAASILDYVAAMRERNGNVFIMPGLFGRPDVVVTTDPKDIETIFRNEGVWPVREGFDSIVYYRKQLRPDIYADIGGLVAAQGEEWAKIRTTMNPIMMQPRNMQMYYEPLSRINDEFIERIKEIRDPNSLEVPADFAEEIYRLVFESLALIAFNREMGIIRRQRDNPDVLKLFEFSRDIFRLIFKLDIQPSLWKWYATPTYKKLVKTLDDSLEITQKFVNESKLLVEERKRKNENVGDFSILEKILQLDEKIATIMATDILFAGVDGTSVLLSAILLCLAKNPDKQERLRQEILQVMPTKDTQLNEQRMKQLPYMRAVIKETLRYYPNGIGTFRSCGQDLTLSGYTIPKGTRVIAGANVLLRDERYYPRAREFLPERWLRDETTQKKTDFNPFTYIPFGFGPRICVGRRIVDLEVETALAKLLRNFQIEFNHDASKPFKSLFLMELAIPLKFKFIDIPE